MKHINIFVIYQGKRTTEEMLERVDRISPEITGLDGNDIENYLVYSDIKLSKDILEKLYFATQVYPYKINGISVGFDCRFSFFNLPIAEDPDIRYYLEERGFEFKPLSENMELLSRVFHWYSPVNHYGESPPKYKRSYRKNPTIAFVLPLTMDEVL
jgi:hypothetical protein